MAEHNSSFEATKFPSPYPQTKEASPRFQFKALLFALFVLLLPLVPAQAPEFINQTIFTKAWELVHLLFVGIAVSYGLFSRKNTHQDAEKATNTPNSAQSYISQILHGSSMFDDDEQLDDGKMQSWSSLHHPSESEVMVNSNGGGNRSNGADNPLFLPVRSLKTQPPEAKSDMYDQQRRSFDASDSTGNTTVLPSPIPWRSRSGRFDTMDHELSPSFIRSSLSRASSTIPSPKKLSPSPSLSSEIIAKNGEDSVKKRSSYKSAPPPAPPPPPQFINHGYHPLSDKSRSFKDEIEDHSIREKRDLHLHSSHSFNSSYYNNNNNSAVRSRRSSLDGSSSSISSAKVGKSVRTIRPREVQSQVPEHAERWDEPVGYGYRPYQPTQAPKFQHEKAEDEKIVDKAIVTSDDSESSEDGNDVAKYSVKDASKSVAEEKAVAAPGMEENEVDKKADEFIARFREQIRLQRIESIKRSVRAGQS